MLDLKQVNENIKYLEMKDLEGNVIHVRIPTPVAQELIKGMADLQKQGKEDSKLYETKVRLLFDNVINNNAEGRKYKGDYASVDLKKLFMVYYLAWYNAEVTEANKVLQNKLEEVKAMKAGE